MVIMTSTPDNELLIASRILYGESVCFHPKFLDSLQLTDLKQTYRRRSLETHPDRYLHLGLVHQQAYTELFQQVREAYEKLGGFLRLRSSGIKIPQPFEPRPGANPPTSRAATPPFDPAFSSGTNDKQPFDPSSFFRDANSMPPWRLRLGEFLFYSGVISWNTLISAILWQGRQRERLGDIALRWGWLTEEELQELLHDRHVGERLGGILLRHQIVTPFQLKMLLIHQRQKQPRIGEFFVGEGIIPPFQLPPLVNLLRERNRKFENDGKIPRPPY
jgi:hypothetical protein